MDLDKKYYENDKLWKPSAFDDLEHARIEITSRMIPEDVISVVDVGCGNGLFLNYLSGRVSSESLKLLGVDTSESALKYVKTDKALGNISKLPFESKSWDLVSALEIIEHLSVDEYEAGLRELARVSRKYILISVPYDQTLEDAFRECPLCKTRFNSAHHKRSFDESAMKALFSDEGFENTKLMRFGKDPELIFIGKLYRIYRKFKPLPIKPLSPCPVCGYYKVGTGLIKKKSWYKNFASKMRVYWPKRYKSRWIIALYTRRDEI